MAKSRRQAMAPLPEETTDLKRPWQNRMRNDSQVAGAIDLSYMRGYQAGWEDCQDGKTPRYFVNLTEK